MKKTICIALCLGLLNTPVAFATPKMFGADQHIGKVADSPELSTEMRRVYRQFRREAKYFAAMAVNFETGTAFYIQNFHDLNRVKIAALEGCRQIAAAPGCEIYAVAMPKSLPIGQAAASGLSKEGEEIYNDCYQNCRKPGTYGAFAISGASHQGFSYGWKSEADARDTAISYCQIGVARDMADLGPEARKFARERGWQYCKVVDVNFTPAD